MSGTAEELGNLLARIRRCRLCLERPRGRPLPHEPRPVVQASATARLLIAGQAPGVRVHASGRPFTDPSGDRLRAWLDVDSEVFYDPARIAIAPMGFCFPGLDAHGGDLPPRPECAAAWREKLMAAMPDVELIVLLGRHAQTWHLREAAGASLADTVKNWRQAYEMTPRMIPLPHPSWRNNGWLKRHPWVERDILPVLRAEVKRLVSGSV